jgi:sialate O-acetylesterase
MELVVADAQNGTQEIAGARDARIRHFKVPHSWAAEPAADLAGGAWAVADSEHVGSFTAVGYFFARALRKTVDVPIGLLNTSWGSTRIESWMSRRALRVEGAELPTINSPGEAPTLLFNKMVHPLLPFPIKGVLWYQGESNAFPGGDLAYRELFPALIRDWRRAWGIGDFPFLFVQLPNYMAPDTAPAPSSSWAVLRESQSAALKLPNTAQVVTIDIGEANDIHPRNKQDVGARLALAARQVAYGERHLVASGPRYRRKVIRDGRVVLEF